ncbi:MAG: tetratricopeptide repeat protein [Saprospiraceae bacterium]
MSKGKQSKVKKTSGVPTGKAIREKTIPHIQEAFPTKWKLAIAAGVALLAMAVYGPSWSYDYVYDDDAVIKENRFVKQGLGGLGKIWTTSYFQGYDENMLARAYRPIPLTTLAAEYEIWGLNPHANHLANLLFYGLTAFFLFLFLSKLLRAHHPALPVAICLLFMLHPIHLEVVANIKSRDTMLGFLNLIIALWFLLKHLDNRKIQPLALALFFYFIALFSKEEIITSLATIPLLLWFFRDYSLKKIAFSTLPFVAAVAVFLLIRSSILGGLNEGVTLTYLDNSLLAAQGIAQRSASNILVLGHYLLKTVFPHPLISDYSYSTIPLATWGDWRVYASLLANMGLLVLGIYGLIKRKAIGFGPLYYFATVSIFTSIIVTNVSAYNDRFLYSPVLGICFLLAWLLSFLLKNSTAGGTAQVSIFFRENFTAVAITAVLCSLFVYKISGQLPFWKDRYVLFEHDVKLAPNNARMRKNHGGSLARLALQYQQSDKSLMEQYARQAIGQLDTALSLYNNMPTGHIHKGNMHLLLGEYDQAEQSLKTALQQDPRNYYASTSLGNLYYRQGRYREAIEMLENIKSGLRSENDNRLLKMCYDQLGNGQ